MKCGRLGLKVLYLPLVSSVLVEFEGFRFGPPGKAFPVSMNVMDEIATMTLNANPLPCKDDFTKVSPLKRRSENRVGMCFSGNVCLDFVGLYFTRFDFLGGDCFFQCGDGLMDENWFADEVICCPSAGRDRKNKATTKAGHLVLNFKRWSAKIIFENCPCRFPGEDFAWYLNGCWLQIALLHE